MPGRVRSSIGAVIDIVDQRLGTEAESPYWIVVDVGVHHMAMITCIDWITTVIQDREHSKNSPQTGVR